MLIHSLALASRSPEEQHSFYSGTLGFKASEERRDHNTINAGATKLKFQKSVSAQYYHFAFLIPEGRIEACMDYVEKRGIRLLPLDGSKIIEFDPGRSIYFFDPDGNIAEFIERPVIKGGQGAFSIDEVVRVNEISYPVEEPLRINKEFRSKFGIEPGQGAFFREDFCWCGDYEGVFLLTRPGRNWLPTQKPAVPNSFEIEFETAKGIFRESL